MAWHRKGDEPLSDPMVALFYDILMRFSVSMIWNGYTRGWAYSVYEWIWIVGDLRRHEAHVTSL